MSQPKVFVTRQIPQAGLDALLPHVQVEVWPDRLPPPYSILLEKVKQIDGLLCLLTDSIDQAVIEAGRSLKAIAQMAVGYDNIDIAAATARGIPVGYTPGVLTEATADLTWALLMAAARRLPEAQDYIKQGQWQTWEPTLLLGADLVGKTLGIVGLGRIGAAVARRARGWNMRVIYTSRQRHPGEESTLGVEYVSLEQLLAEADFVTLHPTLTEKTYHLIDEPQFELMKSSAILINTARGSIINPEALSRALKQGKIARAAIDVTEPEPLPVNSPLLTLPNLIVTPHIGSASEQTRSLMALMAAQNLLAGLRGEVLPHCVNPEVYQQENYQLKKNV